MTPHELAGQICATLRHYGHPAYLVGRRARDLDLGHEPAEDNACKLPRSDCVQELFPHSLASGPKFGMFLVVEDGA